MDKITILFVNADIQDPKLSRLQLGEEIRNIKNALQSSVCRDKFKFESIESARPKDLTKAISQYFPQIFHFSGHGSIEGELCFQNGNGQTQIVTPEALAKLFECANEHLWGVILNCCYSNVKKYMLTQHLSFIIVMENEISYQSAITFTVGFYQALANGYNFEKAFGMGLTEVKFCGLPEIKAELIKGRSLVTFVILFPHDSKSLID
jgi:hypothetical protein